MNHSRQLRRVDPLSLLVQASSTYSSNIQLHAREILMRAGLQKMFSDMSPTGGLIKCVVLLSKLWSIVEAYGKQYVEKLKAHEESDERII